MRGLIYDVAILPLTSRWYAEVLARVPRGARILDVGIGTGGALARNADTVREKDLRIVGVDIDRQYVSRCKKRVSSAGLDDRVEVHLQSILDHRAGPYDAIYFSASFMLMPDPPQVLRHVAKLLAEGGQLYFTQTFQEKRSTFMERTKPLLRRVTTIEFGRVTYEDDFRRTLDAGGVELREMLTLGRSGGRSYRLAVADRAAG